MEYQNNVNAGLASVTIEGINDYIGTQTLFFTIDKADRQNFSVFQQGWTFGEIAPAPNITGEEEKAQVTYMYARKEGGVFSSDLPTNAGEYVIKAEIVESQNYKASQSTATFVISPKNIESFTISVGNYDPIYTGKAICPAVILHDGKTALVENVDFVVSYKNNVNAGTFAVIVVNGVNNYAGTIEKNFEIQKSTVVNINTEIHLDHKFEKLSNVKLPDDFEWEENSLVVVSDNVFTATAVYNGGNYDIQNLEFTIIIDGLAEPSTNGNTVIWLAVTIPVAVAICLGGILTAVLRKKRR